MLNTYISRAAVLAGLVGATASIDGNTVEENVENKEFTTNAMSYNASFEFLNGKFKGLTNALRGE